MIPMNHRILIAIFLMAVVTYLPRVLPLALVRKKIKNRFVQSFLLYMPYGVLAAMVFPDILSSTANLVSALCGMATALVLAYKNKGLLPVALSATAVVFVVEQTMKLIGV